MQPSAHADNGGFACDGSGNPTQYNGSAANTYAYDPEQRLTGLGGFSAHYDGDGLRDYTIASGTTTYFVYDGSSPVLEETYSGTTTTIQVANGMADGWRERYAATSFGFNAYGFDPQGNLNVEDSSFDTTLPAQNVYVYDGYGNRLVGERVSNGSTTAFNVDPVQFGGQYGYYTDTSTGEVDLTHRYYDTATGHFLNRDPIGYNGGQNLYAYCGNNPIMNSDPEGTASEHLPAVGMIDPHEVRFSQDGYTEKMTGGTVTSLTHALKTNTLTKPLEPVRLLMYRGNIYTLDNRRVLAASRAHVEIPYRWATKAEVAREWRRKFTTENGGVFIEENAEIDSGTDVMSRLGKFAGGADEVLGYLGFGLMVIDRCLDIHDQKQEQEHYAKTHSVEQYTQWLKQNRPAQYRDMMSRG